MNRVVPTVEVELDRKRPMALTMGAMIDFEKMSGKSFFMLGRRLTATETMQVTIACLQAALPKGEKLDLTEDYFRQLDPASMRRLSDAIAELATLSMPPKGEEGPLEEGVEETPSAG